MNHNWYESQLEFISNCKLSNLNKKGQTIHPPVVHYKQEPSVLSIYRQILWFLIFLSLTLRYTGGGGHNDPPLSHLCCGAFQSDPRGSKFWYNSYFIVTMDIQKVLNLKGVSKKIWSIFLEAGVKN